jgi:hypothetical protein
MKDMTSATYCGKTKVWRAFLRRNGAVALSYGETLGAAIDDCCRMLGVSA